MDTSTKTVQHLLQLLSFLDRNWLVEFYPSSDSEKFSWSSTCPTSEIKEHLEKIVNQNGLLWIYHDISLRAVSNESHLYREAVALSISPQGWVDRSKESVVPRHQKKVIVKSAQKWIDRMHQQLVFD
jgi:hypothetical protein